MGGPQRTAYATLHSVCGAAAGMPVLLARPSRPSFSPVLLALPESGGRSRGGIATFRVRGLSSRPRTMGQWGVRDVSRSRSVASAPHDGSAGRSRRFAGPVCRPTPARWLRGGFATFCGEETSPHPRATALRGSRDIPERGSRVRRREEPVHAPRCGYNSRENQAIAHRPRARGRRVLM